MASGFNARSLVGPTQTARRRMAAPKATQPSKESPDRTRRRAKEQVRIGAIVAGEGKFAISDRAKAANVKNPTQQDKNSNTGERFGSCPPAGVAPGQIDEGPKAALKGRWALIGPALSFFSESLLSTRRRMRRRRRSRVLTSVRTAARNFDLLLAIDSGLVYFGGQAR
jgi:hypothetical protein